VSRTDRIFSSIAFVEARSYEPVCCANPLSELTHSVVLSQNPGPFLSASPPTDAVSLSPWGVRGRASLVRFLGRGPEYVSCVAEDLPVRFPTVLSRGSGLE